MVGSVGRWVGRSVGGWVGGLVGRWGRWVIWVGSEQGISESESVTDSSEARDVFDDGWTAKSKFKNSKNATDSEP